MEPLGYAPISSRFGTLGIGWSNTPDSLRVIRIFLPNESHPALPKGHPLPPAPIAELAASIRAYLDGEVVSLGLDLLDWSLCGEFQRRVLLAEYGIPRGRVSTYGRIAAHLGVPGAARAVGTALGRNPFPIVIPCHRAVCSDGSLGGYRGGLPMKRTLLEMEGVEFSPNGKVLGGEFYY